MKLDVALDGRRVIVLGTAEGSALIAKRYAHAGAAVTVANPVADPTGERLYLVHYLDQPDEADRSGWLDLLAGFHLVVQADLDEGVAAAVNRLCAELQLLTVTEKARTRGGRVTLVGGGPGVSELLTIGACRALLDADSVFYDRLAPHEELELLAPTADLVDVGKLPLHHAVSQAEIQQAMITRARAGEHVVRLKGGDPFVFGRGREEVQACLDAGIPVEVIPGITSALAVPAAAGIPVTHREASRMFTVVSGHVPLTPAELVHLAGLNQTIVVLMGVTAWPQLQAGLIEAGLPAETPAAIVERGYSRNQRSTVATLGRLAERIAAIDITAPAVVVVGEVVRQALTDPGAAEIWAGLADLGGRTDAPDPVAEP